MSASPVFQPALAHRLWRRLPVGMRRQALARATGWLAGPPVQWPVAPGVAVAGELTRASGLGEAARLMAEGARRSGLPVWTINLPPLADGRHDLPLEPSAFPPDGVPLVLHVNAPLLPLALLRLPPPLRRQHRIIGYWSWELPAIPPDWRPALGCVNQVWVPSRFTAEALDALEPSAPADNRQAPPRDAAIPASGLAVRVVPPPMAAVPPSPSRLDRAAFGLPHDALIVLVSFNLASSFARKNPLASIAAFRQAFGDRPDRILFLKIGHADHAPEDLAVLARHAQAPNIRLETRILPPADSHALTACADIVLSLHRAEGFGLVMAEAMLLAKPVVATAWSGNMDYMTADVARLVPFRLTPAQDARHVYHGLWAEPDIAVAAEHLRALAADPALRHAIGARARLAALARFDAQPLLDALRGLA